MKTFFPTFLAVAFAATSTASVFLGQAQSFAPAGAPGGLLASTATAAAADPDDENNQGDEHGGRGKHRKHGNRGDERNGAMRESIEQRCFTLLAREQPVATDLRTITTAMRVVSDLERMGDLAEHVAKVARMRFPDSAVPQELRPVFLEAGKVAETLVAKAATVIATLDVDGAAELEADDDLMDDLHRQLFRTVLSDGWSHGMEAGIDMTLLGRYYERFADHAVSVARRVVYLVTGERAAVTARSGA